MAAQWTPEAEEILIRHALYIKVRSSLTRSGISETYLWGIFDTLRIILGVNKKVIESLGEKIDRRIYRSGSVWAPAKPGKLLTPEFSRLCALIQNQSLGSKRRINRILRAWLSGKADLPAKVD